MDTIKAKTIVTVNKSDWWFGSKFNMNIYKGCVHGCIYCDSRSECYRIENFDTIRSKEDALRIIRDDLRRKKFKGVISTGSMSDPYNPFEKEHQLTRHALELISAYGFGVAIATKSDLVTRDIDVLKEIQKHSPVLVKVTITTADDDLCRQLEPNVCVTSKRFAALKEISDAGINTCILMMPLLPWINDNEENVLSIVRRAHESGVKYIYPAFGVTLRTNQRDYYYQKIDKLFPGLSQKYKEKYKESYQCGIPNHRHISKVFESECKKYGIKYKMQEIIDDYQKGYKKSQMSLFDELNNLV